MSASDFKAALTDQAATTEWFARYVQSCIESNPEKLVASLCESMEHFATDGSESAIVPERVQLAVLAAYDAGIFGRQQLLPFILTQMSIAAEAHPYRRSRRAPEVIWFALLHNQLRLTDEDYRLHAVDYARFLASSNPDLCDFGIAHIKVENLDPDSAVEICASISASLVDAGKERALKGLRILAELARTDPKLQEPAANAAVDMLQHSSENVQKQALNLIARLQASEAVWQKLADRVDRLAVLPRDQASKLLKEVGFDIENGAEVSSGANLDQLIDRCAQVDSDLRSEGAVDTIIHCVAQQKTAYPAIKLDWRRIPVLDREHPFEPLQDLDDLLFHAVRLLHGSSDVLEAVLDGIARMCAQRPEDFQERVSALTKLAESKIAPVSRRGAAHLPFSSPDIQICLADLILSWTRGADYLQPCKDKFAQLESSLTESAPTDILRGRLLLLAKRVSNRQAGPLLSTPTHARCWIDPRVAIERLISLRKLGIQPDFYDFVQMIRRFSPEHSEDAQLPCQYISGTYGDVLRALFSNGSEYGLPKRFVNALYYGRHYRSIEYRYPAYESVPWQDVIFPDEPLDRALQFIREFSDTALELCIAGVGDGRLDADALAKLNLSADQLAKIAACSPLHKLVVRNAVIRCLLNNDSASKTAQTHLLELLYTYSQELGLDLDDDTLAEKLKTVTGKKAALMVSKLLALKTDPAGEFQTALLMALENRVERIERWQRWRTSERLQQRLPLPLEQAVRLRDEALSLMKEQVGQLKTDLILPTEYKPRSPFARAAGLLLEAIELTAGFDEQSKTLALSDLYEHLVRCYLCDSDYKRAAQILSILLSTLELSDPRDFDKLRWTLSNLFQISLQDQNVELMDHYGNRLFALLQDIPNMHHRLEIALHQAADFRSCKQDLLAEDMYKLVLELAQLTGEDELFKLAEIELVALYRSTGNHRAVERTLNPGSNPDERPMVGDVDGWYECLRYGKMAMDKANYPEAREFFVSAITKATDKSLTVQREITQHLAELSRLLIEGRLEMQSVELSEAALKESISAFGEANFVAIWCLEDLASADVAYNDGRRSYSMTKRAAEMKVKLGLAQT
jgi:hypothetical protein